MRIWLRRLKLLRAEESGVIAPTVILLLPILLAFCGLALDVGMIYAHRRSLQNAADAAALAGTRQLQLGILDVTTTPVEDAETEAAAYAARNGVAGLAASCSSAQTATLVQNQPGPESLGFAMSMNDQVVPRSWQVTTSRAVPLVFGPFLGKRTQCVTASAIGVVTELKETKLFPWGLLKGCPADASSCSLTDGDPNYPVLGSYEYLFETKKYDTDFLLKAGASDASSGNFGIVDFTCDGNKGGGSADYINLMYEGYGTNGEPIPELPWTVCTGAGNDANGNKGYAQYINEQLNNPCLDDGGQSIKCPIVGLIPIIAGYQWPSGKGQPITIIDYAVFQVTDVTAQATGQMQIRGHFLRTASGIGQSRVPNPNGDLIGLIGIRLWQP